MTYYYYHNLDYNYLDYSKTELEIFVVELVASAVVSEHNTQIGMKVIMLEYNFDKTIVLVSADSAGPKSMRFQFFSSFFDQNYYYSAP